MRSIVCLVAIFSFAACDIGLSGGDSARSSHRSTSNVASAARPGGGGGKTQTRLPVQPPSECKPGSDMWRGAQLVRQEMLESIRELVVCGTVQVATARAMVLSVLLSNEGLFEPEAVEEIAGYLDLFGLSARPVFVSDGEGGWHMAFNPQSRFSLRFHDPADGSLITADVFDIESYLEGVEVESSHTWAEMKGGQPNHFTFRWKRIGPLGHLLFPEGEPESRTLELDLYLDDLIYLIFSGFDHPAIGPFQRLGDVLVESSVHLLDRRPGVKVEYTASGKRGVVRELALGGNVAFFIDDLYATNGHVQIEATGSALDYFDGKGLQGPLVYRMRMPRSADMVVTDEYGDGALYPTPTVACARTKVPVTDLEVAPQTSRTLPRSLLSD